MPRRLWLLPLFLTLGVVLVWQRGPKTQAQPAPGPSAPKNNNTFKYLGAGSCAAMACHNGQGPPGAYASEYTTWVGQGPHGQMRDKHAQAYDVLFNDVSRTISHNLRRPVPPHQDSLCLNCHVLPDYSLQQKLGRLAENFASDGVSCESCHGPAEKWLADHHRPGFTSHKNQQGMADTVTLATRAKMCAGCHVGAVDHDGVGREVNHDLYGAGHPPLVFEFAAFHATTPHHWQDYKDLDPGRSPGRGRVDFNARTWMVGQLVSAQSALDVLAERASNPRRPWPEFAEYDCFSCHHDLKGKSWRQTKEHYQGRKPGALRWRTWYTTMLPRAASLVGGEAADLQILLESLRQEMEKPTPDRGKVALRAQQASQKLGSWIERSDKNPPLIDLDTTYQTILKKDRAGAQRGWDEASQVYLSLAALHNAWTDQKLAPPGPLRPTLGKLEENLQWPTGYKSPVNFNPTQVQKLLLELVKKTP